MENIPPVPVATQPTAPPPSGKGGGLACGCLTGCFVIPAILLLIIVGVVAWFIAAMGLSNIPLLTTLAYHQPQPVHVVQSAPASQAILPPDFVAQLQQVSNGNVSPEELSATMNSKTVKDFMSHLTSFGSLAAGGKINLAIPESALTATLRSSANQNNSGPVDLSRAQIAATAGQGLEVYLPLSNNPVGSAIRLDITPTIINGEISASITRVYVGDVELPPSLVASASANTLQAALNALAPQLKSYATFTSVDVADGTVNLQGSLVH